MGKDYYKILEVDKKADEETLKKAYKKLEGVVEKNKGKNKSSFDDDDDAFIESKRRLFDELPKHMCPSSYARFEEFANLQKKHKQPILCHRPPGASSTPVTLLHQIFGQFVDDCKDVRPTSEGFRFIFKLSYETSMFYNNEKERAEMFREFMTEYCGLTFIACEIKGGYKTDGSLVTRKYYYANVELYKPFLVMIFVFLLSNLT